MSPAESMEYIKRQLSLDKKPIIKADDINMMAEMKPHIFDKQYLPENSTNPVLFKS